MLIRPQFKFLSEKMRYKAIEKALIKWLKPLENKMPSMWLVGGSVRDYLLSKTYGDIDLICHDAEKTARALAKFHNGAFVPFLKKADQPCYRVIDRKNPGNFIDITPVFKNSLNSDLKRRDFTVNGIAISMDKNGSFKEIIDPLNGIRDLRKKIIRMTSPDAFCSDPLRILRAFRFAATLKFSIEPETLKSMEKYAGLLTKTASERILYELFIILRSENASEIIRLMDEVKITEVIFPEILPMKNCMQSSFHHLDVWRHSLLVMENCEKIINNIRDYFPANAGKKLKEFLESGNTIPLMKLGAMLHDVGKPETKEYNREKKRVTFYGHHKISAQIVKNIAKRLRMSLKDAAFLEALVSEHMHVLNLSETNVKNATRMRWFRKFEDNIGAMIIHGMADVMSTLGPDSKPEFRQRFILWSVNSIIEYFDSVKPRLNRPRLITGDDLIALGVPKGPGIGKILKKIEEAADAGEIGTRKEALALASSLIKA